MEEIINYITERIKWHNEDIEYSKKAIKDNPDDINILFNSSDLIQNCIRRRSECEVIIQKIKELNNGSK